MLNSTAIKMDVLSDLQQFDILRCIPAKTLQKYLPFFYFRIYKKNQRIFMEGDPRDKIFFLLDGYVMYESGSEEGSMLYLDIVKPNQMLAYGGIFTESYYKNTAIAATDVMVYFVPSHVFEEMLNINAKALKHVISKLSIILSLHQKRVQQILIPNAQERVLHTLQYLMDDLGVKEGKEFVIPCPLTALTISKISGTTRETVSLVMNQLKKEEIISVDAKKIRFHKPEYFKEIN
jgi:CRP-like cAMP-binding protein